MIKLKAKRMLQFRYVYDCCTKRVVFGQVDENGRTIKAAQLVVSPESTQTSTEIKHKIVSQESINAYHAQVCMTASQLCHAHAQKMLCDAFKSPKQNHCWLLLLLPFYCCTTIIVVALSFWQLSILTST